VPLRAYVCAVEYPDLVTVTAYCVDVAAPGRNTSPFTSENVERFTAGETLLLVIVTVAPGTAVPVAFTTFICSVPPPTVV
jgi:hypothetical protein